MASALLGCLGGVAVRPRLRRPRRRNTNLLPGDQPVRSRRRDRGRRLPVLPPDDEFDRRRVARLPGRTIEGREGGQMTVQLSTLRVSADMDASKYQAGAAQKVAADRQMAASSTSVGLAVS